MRERYLDEPPAGARCWTGALEEARPDTDGPHGTQVCLAPAGSGEWRVVVRYRGEPVLDARYQRYSEAADSVMGVFGLFAEEGLEVA